LDAEHKERWGRIGELEDGEGCPETRKSTENVLEGCLEM